uniref:Angiomotin n=1 Tax=Gryllus bimaculatus TaxID=6999 RepID=M5B2A1_GRYBI|nr:angiomotin [Gryllus bimaculatus]
MSSLQQTSRFIPFTNSAQRTQLLPAQSGFPQSLSGSETDVSTSNENLSHEERYVIKHTARQEPQGQENLSSNRSSLDVSSSSYNTLIIHGAGDDTWTGRLSGIRDVQDTNANSYLTSQPYSSSPTSTNTISANNLADGNKAGQGTKMGSHSPLPSAGSGKEPSSSSPNRLFDPSVREITDIPDDYLSQSQVLKHLAKEVKVVPLNSGVSSSRESSVPRLDETSSDVRDDPLLAEQLKRLSLPRIGLGAAKDAARLSARDHEPLLPLDYDLSNLPPPPEYPKWIESPSSVQKIKMSSQANSLSDKLSLSRSHPDLSRIGNNKVNADGRVVISPRPKTNGREDMESQGREIWPPAEMVEILIQENSSLKLELESCYQKVAKSHKLEQEISKIHRAQEELVASSERRERLERTARARLQADVRRLQEYNRGLHEQLDMVSSQLLAARAPSDMGDAAADSLRKELSKREVLIAQLITQNKELVAAKERQEIELAAQRATLQEQRTHIDILDTALTNAQGNVVRLEEECRKKQVYVERVAQLQRALSSLQMASDRREQTERKLRLQLERELHDERARAGGANDDGASDSGAGSAGGCSGVSDGFLSGSESGPELKRRLREREEQIMRLEGEVAKWEQRYLEESALRQAAIDAASIPKDAKIAALEKTSQETEKLIAEARSEKIRHMDEVHAAQKKVADLESRLKDLESKLAERDAMIRVLQKHTYDKDVSYPSVLGRSPHHTPHPSLHGNSDLGVLGTSVSREELDPVSTASVFSTASSVLTSSGSTGISSFASDSTTSKLSSYHPSSFVTRSKYGSVANKSFDDTKKTLDDQLKELDSQLDSQLLSKRGLCCFPGFSNTGTAPRKGKIPKPLLASVRGTSPHHHLFEPGFLQGLVTSRCGEQGRPEEMLLLEKQGRSSQQQRRSGSLPPPTSLPRPRRVRRPPEYGRLSDGEGRKTPAADSVDSSKGRESPARSSNIPSPKKLGKYGRLGEESRTLKKGTPNNHIVSVELPARNGEEPGSTLPSHSKLRLFQSTKAKRGTSIGKDAKSPSTDSSSTSNKSVASTGKYRIQF